MEYAINFCVTIILYQVIHRDYRQDIKLLTAT